MLISEEDWSYLYEKYKNLIYTISTKIGKDRILNDREDSQQNLTYLIYEVVLSFKRNKFKECESYEYGGELLTDNISQFIRTTAFDRYLKTSLWSFKNHTGSKITKKYLLNNTESFDEELFEVENVSFSEENLFLQDLKQKLSIKEFKLVTFILSDEAAVNYSGLNRAKARRTLKVSNLELDLMLSKLKKIL